MPYTLPPIPITAGQTAYVSFPGSMGSITWVKLINASPFLIQLSNLLGGQDYLQPGEANIWNVPGLHGDIQASPQQFTSQNQVAPVSALVVTWYLEGEQPSGTYPVNFGQLVYVGNGLVATQLVNDGNTVGSNIIESTPAGQTQSFWLARNDGTLQIWAISNGVPTAVIDLVPGGASTPASLTLQLLKTLGALSLDNGNIKTDGAGTLRVGTVHGGGGSVLTPLVEIATVPSIGVPPSVSISAPGYGLYTMGGVAAPGNAGMSFQTIWNGATVNAFAIGDNPLNELAYIDHTGALHATAPVQLATGSQETGAAGLEFTAAAASVEGAYMPNFKSVMSRIPTSITLTVAYSSNFKGLSADTVGVNGFRFVMQSVAAGLCQWIGNYSTVGNCLLAYDARARTFDHHCDNCGAVHRGVALAVLDARQGPTPARCGLAYTCPDCGTSEHFNCGLSAEDEADATPQGQGEYATTRGAQATMIRQLLTALALPIIA